LERGEARVDVFDVDAADAPARHAALAERLLGIDGW
jgi:hypothetical protein